MKNLMYYNVKRIIRQQYFRVWILFFVLCVIIGIQFTILLQAEYVYDPQDAGHILNEGEKGLILFDYGGAENYPLFEYKYYEKLEPIFLPTDLYKEGYIFTGWDIPNVNNVLYLNNKETTTCRAQFKKNYYNEHNPIIIYTNELEYESFEAKDYAAMNVKADEIYINGPYKITVYSKENFEGKGTQINYYQDYSGRIKSMKVQEIKSDSILCNSYDSECINMLLHKFAPRFWWAKGEQYFADNVENALVNMERVMSNMGYMFIIRDFVYSKMYYKYDMPYIFGDLLNAKVYGFATEKEYNYIDLQYFVFTPFNYGKELFGMPFGNHIGDWENIIVRLYRYEQDGDIYYKPILMNFKAHSFNYFLPWDEIEIAEETHPVCYLAKGSHGIWNTPGEHTYINYVIVKLSDECNRGICWDTWTNDILETYSYDVRTKIGVGVGNSVWNTIFDIDFYNPDSNSVVLWGNMAWESEVTLYPELDSGPSSPQAKVTMNDYYSMNKTK